MYQTHVFGRRNETLKCFKTLKAVHAYLVAEHESKTTYGQLLKAMREHDGNCALYQAFDVICIEKIY